MKKLLCTIVILCCFAAVMCLGASASGDGLDNFYDKYEYNDELFADISDGYWYGKYVAKVFALGLMEGRGENIFAPDDPVTIAETITMAARLHDIYSGGSGEFRRSEPWYKVYTDYALDNGILTSDDWDYNAATTRRDFAAILCAAFPEEAFNVISKVGDGAVPDIDMDDPAAEPIYRLYRAGVLTGSDAKGSFFPDDNISRSAVAAIISRMAIRSMRVEFTLRSYRGPEPPVQDLAGDEFFSDACIIGNSLVEGIRIYSGLKTMTYYSCTGMTAISAVSGHDFRLASGSYGSAMDAMAEKQFSKVYIELGINEIGFPVDTFIDYYKRVIDRVQLAQPNADIYILSLTPVSRSKDAQGTFTMARVNAYNEGLMQLAWDEECYYLDCVTPLVDESGFLAPGDTWDGVHFNIPKYSEWEHIIRTRYADQ